MLLNQKRVLVTGADGFIGSHLVEALIDQGCHVRAFCFYNSLGSLGWLDTIPGKVRANVEIVLGDIRDAHAVRSAVSGVDAVFHLAALIGIPYSYTAPDSYIDTNVKGTLNIVQAARACETPRIIHTSTSEVYGTARTVPITEAHPLVGQSPYSASKIGADQIALSFFYSFGLPLAVARPFNTYGPRQSSRAVIPTIISQIAAGRRLLQLGSLSPTRDFTFVADTCRAFIALAECDAAIGEVVNFGSNFEVSIGDTVAIIGKQMGVDVRAELDPARIRPASSEVERLFSSTEKLQRLTSWRPQYGGLDGFASGLQETIRWFTDPANLRHYRVGEYSV